MKKKRDRYTNDKKKGNKYMDKDRYIILKDKFADLLMMSSSEIDTHWLRCGA